MPTYLLSFHGGSMPEDQEEGVRVMAAWTAWYEELGPAVVDPGNPIGRAMTIEADGTVNDGGGANQVSGYSIIKADDMDGAIRWPGTVRSSSATARSRSARPSR